jgi:hypothetical protein
MHDAGVVEEHVQPAEFALGGGDHLLAVARLRHVGAERDRPPARLAQHADGLGGGLLVEVYGEHARAFFREEQRRLPADSASRAGDQRDFVF